jgi:hypothetical protein
MVATVIAPAVIIRESNIRVTGNVIHFYVNVMDTKSNTTAPKKIRLITLQPGEFTTPKKAPVFQQRELVCMAGDFYNPVKQCFEVRLNFTPQQFSPGKIIPFIVVMYNSYGQELCFADDDPQRHFKTTSKKHPVFEVTI